MMHTPTPHPIPQKQQLIAGHNRRTSRNETFTETQPALWAKEKLKLSEVPKQGTISRIVCSSTHLCNYPLNRSNIHKNRGPKAPKLKKHLCQWICNQNAKHVAVSSAVVWSYAKRLQNETNNLLSTREDLHLKFPNGWISLFQDLFGLKFRQMYREAGSADVHAIDNTLPQLQKLVVEYINSDIWIADEFR